jgi:REP element-mobilizing transposase RayT
MPRSPRIQVPGGLYHVTSHGVYAQDLFREDADRELFLSLLETVTDACAWLCHAYCLMGTHYHLLVETPLPNLAAGLQRLNGRYAQAFNRIHGRTGHLFEARYHAALVERQAHLLEVARYVVLNPVRAGICRAAEEWPWSSYRATAGLERPRALHCVNALLGQLASDRTRAVARYEAFVAEAPDGSAPRALLAWLSRPSSRVRELVTA